jgi:hypothetical protein
MNRLLIVLALFVPSIACVPPSFTSLFDGKTFDGWKVTPDVEAHWKVDSGTFVFDGVRGDLWTKKSFENFELLVDWRWVGPSQGPRNRQLIEPSGAYTLDENGKQVTIKVDERDSGIYLRGNSKSQINIWVWPAGSGEVWGYRTDANKPAETRAAATPLKNADKPIGEWNQFRIRLVGDVLNVHLNNVLVIKDCKLVGVPTSGPIALQAHGSGIAFRNILIRDLP